jgi:hypothetical protein
MEIAKTHAESVKFIHKPKTEKAPWNFSDGTGSSFPIGSAVMEGCPRHVRESDFDRYDGYDGDWGDWN